MTRVSLFGSWSPSLDLSQTGSPPLASVSELLHYAHQSMLHGLLLAATSYARAALETRLRQLVEIHCPDADLPEVAGTSRMLQELGRAKLLDAEQRRFIGVAHARASAVVHNRSGRIEDFHVAYQGCLFACEALKPEGGAE